MSRKGISPIIAIILLLMMTVAVAGAAFFWLTRIQNELQGGTQAFQAVIFTQLASAVDVIDADCVADDTPCDNLTIFFQNTGNTRIPVDDTGDFPTTTWILRNSDQLAVCSTVWDGTGDNVECLAALDGCGPDEFIEVGQIFGVVLEIEGSACNITTADEGEVFSFIVDFSGATSTSASFIVPKS